MALLDDVRRLLLTGRPQPGLVPMPLPPPEPGTPSGGPVTSGSTVTPLAGDGSPQLDSGIHMYQPRDIGTQRLTNRFRRLLNLQTGLGLQDYPGMLVAAMLLNAEHIEDFYPDDILMTGVTTQAQVGAAFTDLALCNPAGSNLLFIVEQVVVARLNTAGAVNIRFAATSTITGVLGAAVATAAPRDERAAAVGPRLFAGTGAIVGAVVGVDFSGVSVNPARITQGFVLIPGQGLTLQADIVNEGMTAGWAWRERPLA